jgi:uncharacterized protein with von Willebrand factor type A (vWA) domain
VTSPASTPTSGSSTPNPDPAAGTVGVAGEPILDLLNGFIIELREAGLPVSLTENLDAMAALRHIPWRTARPSSTRWPPRW